MISFTDLTMICCKEFIELSAQNKNTLSLTAIYFYIALKATKFVVLDPAILQIFNEPGIMPKNARDNHMQ